WCVDSEAEPQGGSYDHASAPWQLGGRTYLPLENEELLLMRFEQDVGALVGCAVRTDAYPE
ncbi:hypothetical protein ACWTQZ_26450, partial [Escherichia coli]